MKKFLIIFISLLVVVFLGKQFIVQYIASNNVVEPEEGVVVPGATSEDAEVVDDISQVLPTRTTIAENLTIPWDIVFLNETEILVTERSGTIVKINTNTGETNDISVPNVSHQGEGGLLGMVAHPDFNINKYLYVYRTSTLGDGTNASINEVVRYRFANDTLAEETVIVGNIPGSLFHNGGRIAFGPDEYLYIATGDARDPESAQDLDSLAGKILRVTNTGAIPADNPFGTKVYSYGHRNPQGLTWDEDGNLWSTEHGRTTATLTGMDELNLVTAGGNYGWPDSEGDIVLQGTIGPKIHSGPSVTWAPGSAIYVNGSVFFAGLRGERLYEAVLENDEVKELREHFAFEYGRIRTTLIGPDGGLYMMTSNRDGRGDITSGDDRIIRLNTNQFEE